MRNNEIDQDFFNVIALKFKEAIKTAEIITEFISGEFVEGVERPIHPDIFENNKHINRNCIKFYKTEELERYIRLKTEKDVSITEEVLQILTQTTNKYHLRFQILHSMNKDCTCISAALPSVGHILQMSSTVDERNVSDIFDVSGNYCW